MDIIFLILLAAQIIALTSLILSKRAAPDLKPVTFVFLLGSIGANLTQWIGYQFSQNGTTQFGFTLFAALLTIASWSHFLMYLAAPRFIRSANYWCLQGVLAVSAILSSSLMTTSSSESLLNSLVTTFAGTAIISVACLILFFVFIHKNSNSGVVQAFRIRSARRLILWSLVLSLLLLFSLPVTPAMATATATCCSCFATMSVRYVIYERRLFLTECAQQALSAPGEPVTDTAISLASSSLDALGDLLSPVQQIASSKKSLAPTGSEAILEKVKVSSTYEGDVDKLFNSLLASEDDSDFEISFDSIRPHLLSLAFLSKIHFGVEIIGNSLDLMEILHKIREEGEASRLTIIQGERGVGKKLLAQALHNLRGNGVLHYIDYSETESITSLEESIHSLTMKSATAQRSTIAITMPTSRQRVLIDIHDELATIQSRDADIVILLEDSANLSSEAAAELRKDSLFIKVPPLRERLEDLVLQAVWFIERYSSKNNLPLKGVSASALRAALIGAWPLNTQELIDTITVTLSLRNSAADTIAHSFLVPLRLQTTNTQDATVLQELLRATFEHTQGTVQLVAKNLRISTDYALILERRLNVGNMNATQAKSILT
jgi:hypothetical protein